MEYSKEDVDRLIEAPLVWFEPASCVQAEASKALQEAIEPFRKPKPARILQYGEGVDGRLSHAYVQATDAVKARLGPTGGVSFDTIHDIILNGGAQYSARTMAGRIAKLIADAAPDIDGEL